MLNKDEIRKNKKTQTSIRNKTIESLNSIENSIEKENINYKKKENDKIENSNNENSINGIIEKEIEYENDVINNKENNIKENNNNIVNYFDIPDLWDKAISGKGDFHKELNDLKELNIKLNQVIYLYDFLGEDINENFFEDVEKLLKKEEEIKKIEEKPEPVKEDVKPPDDDDDDSYDYNAHKSEDEDDGGNYDDKYV